MRSGGAFRRCVQEVRSGGAFRRCVQKGVRATSARPPAIRAARPGACPQQGRARLRRPGRRPARYVRMTSGSSPGNRELAGNVETSRPADVFARAYRLTTAGLLMLVTFVAFESMAVATAMPTAVSELDGLAWYGWPFSAYLVASVFGMVLGGDLDDRRGSRAPLLGRGGRFGGGGRAAGR